MKQFLLLFFCICLCSNGFSQIVNTNISNGVTFDGEPFVAINPANTQNLVAAWMGLKFSGGVFRIAIKTRASFDGGATWSTANSLPHFGTGYTSADVSMAFDKNGLLFISYIDSHQSPDSGGVYVSRSADGGLNWDTPSKAFDVYDVLNKFPVDRPWIAVDKSNTTNSGTVFITTKPAPWIAPPNRNYYKVSTDSGHTWTAITNVDGGNYLVGNYIAAPMATPAITAGGKFCAAYPSYVTSQNPLPAFYLAQSRDKGQTLFYNTMLATVPAASDTNLKNGYLLVANPADSNQMIFVTPDAAAGDADITAIHSNDGGQTWSSKVRVNDDSVANGKAQDMVWASYNKQGKLVVTWRDRRNATGSGFWNTGYDFYYATSSDNGQTFSPNQKLSSQFIAFDSIIAQNGNDFMSCTFDGDTLYSVWGDTRTGKMNIFFAKTLTTNNSTLGISLLDATEETFIVYPNPCKDWLNAEVSDKLNAHEILLINTDGKTVKKISSSSTHLKIDVANLPSGIYFLRAGNTVRKFIKE
jgi:hypothetical protein